ncbi:MAG TPA: FecR family protein [Myxococcaceae bacterium]|nr:FecR family protein [Myxococcaceae bacterium]
MSRLSLPFAALLLLPSLALASVGEVSVLEGEATRTAKGGKPQALKVGSAVELHDTLNVKEGGSMKLTLTDKSVLMIGPGSELEITEAKFKDQEREGFTAYLNVGKVWAKVSKALAGSDAKFEVQTDRAVAGVRGTIFRVDATKMLDAAKPKQAAKSYTVVRVADGKVAVKAPKVAAAAANKPPAQLMSQVGLAQPKPKAERRQVAGPQQITKEAWEAKFTELQKNRLVMVGDELWHEGEFQPDDEQDAFAGFVKKHEPTGPHEE